ncbi:cytochrome P450 [Bradyrhizobium sp. USDA 4472]
MLHLPEVDPSESFCPPAPRPPDQRLGLFKLLATLKRNPLECWSAEFFREPIARVRLPFTDAILVHDPAAIKHVLVDNAANYRKDPIQRRILASGLADGLLSVEGERWEVQRRTLAPLFAKRTVTSFTSAMLQAADQNGAEMVQPGTAGKHRRRGGDDPDHAECARPDHFFGRHRRRLR